MPKVRKNLKEDRLPVIVRGNMKIQPPTGDISRSQFNITISRPHVLNKNKLTLELQE